MVPVAWPMVLMSGSVIAAYATSPPSATMHNTKNAAPAASTFFQRLFSRQRDCDCDARALVARRGPIGDADLGGLGGGGPATLSPALPALRRRLRREPCS